MNIRFTGDNPAECGDPAVGTVLLSFIAPFLALLVGNQQMLRNVAPKLFDKEAEPQEIMHHFSTFAFGGLEATRARLEKERGAEKNPWSPRRRDAASNDSD